MKPLWVIWAIFVAGVAVADPMEETHSHPAPDKLGQVRFVTSCVAEVQPDFERAVALLHSFAYEVSAEAFAAVAHRDPSCALAHWGIAMSHYHQLWSPPAASALQIGRDEVEKAQRLGARSQREQQFIAAAAAYFGGDEHAAHPTRAHAYEQAMAALAAQNPADTEAQVFYALALIGTASPTDRSHSNQKQAAAILEPIFRAYPDHPGAAHYLIHAYDSAELASRGLPAARAYSKIAPSAPHALHMPSHIFTRLGLWDDSIESNQAARLAAHSQGDRGEELHAMDYLTYAYLQRGRDDEAGGVLSDLRSMGPLLSNDFKAGYAATAMPVRLAVERQQWAAAESLEPLPESAPHIAAIVYWARAVARARSGHPDAAASDIERIDQCQKQSRASGDLYWSSQIDILSKEARAWKAAASGRSAEAVQVLKDAANTEDGLEKLPVTPGPIIPAREQLGELLLNLHRPQDALRELQTSLLSTPGRRGALLAGIRAADQAGDSATAGKLRASLQTNAPTPKSEAESMAPGPATLADWAKGAQLFAGLGNFHRAITTKSPQTQRYFDQGMRLLWAFNHDESTRSFARAAELDPDCAICLWGVALTVGPNYNLPVMAESRAKVAWDALNRARQLDSGARPVESALIRALEKRYRGPTPLDPTNEQPVLTDYASAMRVVAHDYPDDLDVQTLFAESMMTANAWKLWDRTGKPAAGTDEIVATLERVLKRDPRHPGANHYYIHALEASPHPDRALGAAARLGPMMPAAGHLVHMPAHILQRVGRYKEAAQANTDAAAADAAYLSKTQPLDYYPMYVAHNYSFLAYSTAMEGRKTETLLATRKLGEAFPQSMMLMMPGTDWYGAQRYLAYVRFGLWDDMLAEPAPNEKLLALRGAWLFGRTFAFAAKGEVAKAKENLALLRQVANTVSPDAGAGLNQAKDVLAVALTVAEAQIAARESRHDEATKQLTEAVSKEDALSYDEPADWFFPVRHLLGAELLANHQPAEAERVFREDLARNPENGWALRGLSEALRAQGKSAAAKQVEQRFASAWREADVVIESSAL